MCAKAPVSYTAKRLLSGKNYTYHMYRGSAGNVPHGMVVPRARCPVGVARGEERMSGQSLCS